MAIGDFGNNGNANNNQKSSDTTYYSRFKIRSKDNRRSLGVTFWSGLLIININDVETANGFKVNELECVRLSPNKAKILASEIRSFKEYIKAGKIDENKAFGVTAGLGSEVRYIAFSCTKDDNHTVVITIGRINDSGSILSSQSFPLDNDEFLYALEWNNVYKMEAERVQYENLELDMLLDTLDDFGKHMNGALAYSVLDLARYDSVRMNRRFDALYDKLGIEKFVPGQGGGNRSGSNNFLNNLAASNRSSNATTLESLEDMLDD